MASRISLGLQRIIRLLQKIDNPHEKLDVIHIAGTNGKGSVSAMVANTLSRAGYKTGLYTSPHLTHRWDVISIDGQTIPQAAFLSLEKELKLEEQTFLSSRKQDDRSRLTTFELLTTIAFEAFHREQVDLAVVEVGLGGRDDATNVVSPLISVITSIGIDHTAFLGTDIKSIAEAKGGIVKVGVPVVASSDQEHHEVFGVLGQVQRNVDSTRKIKWTPPNSTLDFRISNQNTARTVLQMIRGRRLKNGSVIDPEILTDEFIEEGIRTTHWKGRCENLDLSILGGPNTTVLDGAHNAQSVEALAKIVAAADANAPRMFIFALTEGKDPLILAKLLVPGDRFIAVEFEAVDGMSWITPLPSKEIVRSVSMQFSDGSVRGVDFGSDVLGAIQASKVMLPHSDLVICGSLYLVGQVHRLLESGLYEQSFAASQTTEDGSMGTYDPTVVESRIESYWSALPPAKPAPTRASVAPMSFLLPPPNVTGSLHIGHALTIAIQDAWARYYSAKGHDVSWIPGIDHAGIATQSAVSKSLAKSGVDSSKLTKDAFIEEIWKWRDDFGQKISAQICRMGTSLDWNEEYFTMDHARSIAVLEAFRRLWEAGLVKREKRFVNWSIKLQSVISDIEVESRTIESPITIDRVEFGKMWRIKFPLISTGGHDDLATSVEVDTTRPETIFGDRALAVHPEDVRYANLVGRSVKHPLLPDVTLTIVADEFVQLDFGTGCVKLTPAHDPNDYQVQQRHNFIPIIPVFGKDGKMLSLNDYPELTGLDRLTAREIVIDLLERRSLLSLTQPHKTTLSICSRSGSLIEPMLLPQWFVHMAPLASEVLAKDDILMTQQTRKEWTRWLSNVQDWCVSRQLIWGHRIPLYRVVDDTNPDDRWVFGRDLAEAQANANGREVVQDDDVFDTWFSSALLPLSAFNWPVKALATGSLSRRLSSNKLIMTDHKLEFIESGPDILFFWLARMAMICTFLSGTSPFREIVLHPLIRDSQGRKMSKSLGNVINPMSIIEGQSLSQMITDVETSNLSSLEIKKAVSDLKQNYSEGITPAGSDALRYALIQSTMQSEALKFDMRSVMGGQYLCNKLWNAAKFYCFNTRVNAQPMFVPRAVTRETDNLPSLITMWLSYEFNKALKEYHIGFSARQLSAATECLRSFFVDSFCDIYLEFVKVESRDLTEHSAKIRQLSMFREVLENVLKLSAPFIPFISEDLWHILGNRSSIHRQALPQAFDISNFAMSDSETHSYVDDLLTILKSLRCIDARKSIAFTIHCDKSQAEELELFKHYSRHIKGMTGAKAISVVNNAVPDGRRVVPINPTISLSYEITESLVHNAEPGESTSSASQQKNLVKLGKLENMVSRKDYQDRVPQEVRDRHLAQIEALKIRIARAGYI